MSVCNVNSVLDKYKYMQEKNKEEIPNLQRQGWSIEEINEQSVNKPSDEMTREVLRGDETKGDPNERDEVGASRTIDTPQGREEAKNK
jgi:IS30 family transposase